jgi:hypothetical protein
MTSKINMDMRKTATLSLPTLVSHSSIAGKCLQHHNHALHAPLPPQNLRKMQLSFFAQDATKSGGPRRASTSKTVPFDDSSTHSTKASPSKSPAKEPTNVRCKTCGALGHVSAVCPESKPSAQVHAMTETDDASVTSDSSSIFILAQQPIANPSIQIIFFLAARVQ